MDLVSKELTSVEDGVDSPFDFYSFLIKQMDFEKKYRFLRLEMGNLYTSYPKVKSALEHGIEKKAEEFHLNSIIIGSTLDNIEKYQFEMLILRPLIGFSKEQINEKLKNL